MADADTVIEIGRATVPAQAAAGVEVIYGPDEAPAEASAPDVRQDDGLEEDYAVDDAPPMGLTQKVVLVCVAALAAFGIGYLVWFWMG